MDVPRGPTIALPIPNTVAHPHYQHPRRHLSRCASQTFSHSGQPSPSMSIPGARMDGAPPALPPPRYNNDLDHGFDLAWTWQNENLLTGKSKLAPIKPGSSLLGRPSDPQLAQDDDEHIDVDLTMHHNPLSLRAASSTSPSRFATLTLGASATPISSLIRGPPLSSGINQRLQGDHPLAQQNHHQSTHAYDKHLLLKIGKSNSPPACHSTSSRERLSSAPQLSIQTRSSDSVVRPAIEHSSTFDPVNKWMASPTSALSPYPRSSWREHTMNPRSPSYDSYSPSLTLDSEPYSRYNTRLMESTVRPHSTHSPDDTRSRSERSLYESTPYSGDIEDVSDQPGIASRQIEEKPRPPLHHGTKRRALSPSPELFHEHRTDFQPIRSQRSSDVQSAASRQPYRAGSLSSTASSVKYNSNVSSVLSSHAASSMTSLSTLNTPITRDLKQQPVMQTPQSTHTSVLSILPRRQSSEIDATALLAPSSNNHVKPPPARIGNHYICSCCPKKPKKFDKEEKLRIHENEKQYTCAYCNNRFKNKNEAERHQNSLHLRKQSWSCAAISTFPAAFHPSSFSDPRNLMTDTCGFCGEEFSSHPANWEDRIEHLTNVHKFGECNATKKFFRADHFRQHLKHSHAGRSGKWTNILENSCQREESISESASLSPTASEYSQGAGSGRLQGGLVSPADTAMSGVSTIDEVNEDA